MPSTVAFVARVDHASDEEAWLSALRAAMPEETILPFHAMSAEERNAAKLAIVANPDPADIKALPNLEWIHSLWAGVERLVAELPQPAPPIARLIDPELSRVMAEAVLAWSYYLQRDMPFYRHSQEQKEWAPRPYRQPGEMTVGILGLGVLGQAAADRLTAAGFGVKGWSRSQKEIAGVETFSGEDGLFDMLASSDIVVCLLPLTAETRGLISATRLFRMKKGAALINFGRGPVIVEADLLAALDSGYLSHCVLDVFDKEPLPQSSSFWSHPKVTVLPHISGPTTQQSAASVVSANVERWRKDGKLPTTVDLGRGY
jgi:glyoxylate/hydroxypyruvate reductase